MSYTDADVGLVAEAAAAELALEAWQVRLTARAALSALAAAGRDHAAGVAEGRRQAAEALRYAASGRREYVQGNPEVAEVLELEATALESAAKVAEGDLGPLYALLPSWRWTDEMHDKLKAAEGSTE